MPAFILFLFLLSPAANAEVVVVTLPAKGDVTVPLAPAGKADLKRDGTVTRVKIELDRLAPASTVGPSLNTYVVWALSAEGIVENIGEIAVDKDRGRLEATTRFEQLGLLITAEPHYMVDRPGSAVAFRSQAPRNDVRWLNVALETGSYDYSSLKLPPSPGVPALVTQSRAALQIALAAEANRWAEPEFRRARVAADTMEEMLKRGNPFEIVSQSANEAIRRAQQAVTAAREKKAAVALDTARAEIVLLKQEAFTLNSRIQQLIEQQNIANSQTLKLQSDLAASNRDTQKAAQERDQLDAREKAVSRELSDLKAKQEQLQMQLVLALRDGFFDTASNALTPAGRDALARLRGMADVIPGPIRLEGPAPDALFEAARQYLLEAGIPPERIFLKK